MKFLKGIIALSHSFVLKASAPVTGYKLVGGLTVHPVQFASAPGFVPQAIGNVASNHDDKARYAGLSAERPGQFAN